uniref:50S ribosomal protein L11 n=1 Tax=Nephromyces sp. ex Molgula occidentalis TaxID=2544991 RepID=A0A5C1H8C5_9APIC|nr:50S ribosomal protein L11 [Nephromyces sp. ex Molgula occidentalis]
MLIKIINKFKIQLTGQKATPNSFLGSILGPYGINIIKFCQEYNLLTKSFLNLQVPVIVIIYSDKSYKLKLKTPTLSSLINKYSTGINKKYLDKEGLYKIISIKQKDFPLLSFIKIKNHIYKSAQFLGVFCNI